MSELEKILKSVVLGGIGAAAMVVEKSEELAKACVVKGEDTVRQNQDTIDEVKRKAQAVCDAAKKMAGEMAGEIERMTREERDALRRMLDKFDAEDAENEACECDCEEACDCECKADCDCADAPAEGCCCEKEGCCCEDAPAEEAAPAVTYTAAEPCDCESKCDCGKAE